MSGKRQMVAMLRDEDNTCHFWLSKFVHSTKKTYQLTSVICLFAEFTIRRPDNVHDTPLLILN